MRKNSSSLRACFAIRRCAALLATVIGCACGSPTQPSTSTVAPAVLSLPGQWSGFLKIESCADRSGCTTSAVGRIFAFELRVAQAGPSFIATLDTDDYDFSLVDLSGVTQSDGFTLLSGSAPPTSDQPILQGIDVSQLRVRPDPQLGLVGSLSYTLLFRDDPRSVTATILSASLQPIAIAAATPFQGTWEGEAIQVACTGDCPLYYAGRRIGLTLRLAQIGTSVAGEISASALPLIGGPRPVPVSGTASGSSFSLTGEATYPLDFYGVGTTLLRLNTFTAHVDALGRLVGTYRYHREGVRNVNYRNVPFTETVDAELVTVVRRF
jgi:hypothetical protein